MCTIKKTYGVMCGITGLIVMFLLVLVDQGSKLLAIRFLKDRSPIILIEDVLELFYLENHGIAFGMMQGKRIFFIAVCMIYLFYVTYVLIKIPKTTKYIPFIATCFLITSGAVGNFIDRIFRGFVVDFIYVSMINFPVFNMADVYVVCGGVLLVLFVIFKYDEDDFSFLSLKRRG